MEVNTNIEMTLQIALIQKEVSENMLKTRQVELKLRMLDNKLLLSTKEAAKKLGASVDRIHSLYKDGAIQGIEDGKNIKIFYESLDAYLAKTRDPNFTTDGHFSNVQNIRNRARNVTRTESDKYSRSK